MRRCTRLGIVLLAIGLCCIALGQQNAVAAPGFTLEQVRGYGFADSLTAAANGQQVAWVVNRQGRRNVWVAQGPEFKARQLTSYEQDDGQEITSLTLSADGTRVVYVRGGEHSGNWELSVPINPLSAPGGTKVELWSVAFAGGAPQKLGEGDYPALSLDGKVAFIKDGAAWIAPLDGSAPAKQLFSARGTTSALAWSPDGTRLAFVSARESTSYIGIYRDDATPVQWLAPSANRDQSPRWSADGKRIAFVRRPANGGPPAPVLRFEARPWSIWAADIETGRAHPLWRSGETLRGAHFNGFLAWAARGRLIFISYGDGWQHLYSLPDGGGEALLLTSGHYMVEDVALTADRTRLIFSANAGTADDIDRRHLFSVPVDAARVVPLTSGQGLEFAPVVTGVDQVVSMSATALRPPVPAVIPPQGGAPRLIAPELIPHDFPGERLVVPSKVTFNAADGTLVHGQLFRPRTGGKVRRPAIVYVHGGPQRQMLLGWHMSQYYSNDYAVNQYLASRGFVVLAVNYRLGPGYGFDFHFPERAGQRGASEYQDIQAAGRYLQQLPEVDAARIGIYGGSYGGYLTALALARDSTLFKVGVDIHGVHDWVQAFGLKNLFTRRRYEVPVDAELALRTGWESSPVAHAATWRSPVLFITGDDDRNVRIEQTVDLVRRLAGTGVHQESLILVDETHSIHRHANVLSMNAATVEFLERYLLQPR